MLNTGTAATTEDLRDALDARDALDCLDILDGLPVADDLRRCADPNGGFMSLLKVCNCTPTDLDRSLGLLGLLIHSTRHQRLIN